MTDLSFHLVDQPTFLATYDPRTNSWPLVGSPAPIMSIIGVYFLLVTFIGPRLMANRKPLELRNVMLVYNFAMIFINAFFFGLSVRWLDFGRQLLVFEFPSTQDKSDEEIWQLKLRYVYWLTKILDLADTVFFVLRKKQSQVTVLHLYHHSAVPLLGWIAMHVRCTAPGVQLFAFINTAVHVIMYTYYALSALGPEIQKYLWWKRYITQLQLAQFAVLGIYVAIACPFLTNYPTECLWLGAIQPPLFFYMFYDFYKKSYTSRKKVMLNDKKTM